MRLSDHGRGLLRARDGGEQPVTPFELFFDLVYVFAVPQPPAACWRTLRWSA